MDFFILYIVIALVNIVFTIWLLKPLEVDILIKKRDKKEMIIFSLIPIVQIIITVTIGVLYAAHFHRKMSK